jgi:hypothetical protein
LGEGVVVLHEAEARVLELPGQPVVAVDVDLRGEGESGLDTDVAETEVRIEEVEIEHALQPAGEDQPGPAVAVAEFDRAAGLLAAEDADEPLAETAFADLLLNELFLAVRWQLSDRGSRVSPEQSLSNGTTSATRNPKQRKAVLMSRRRRTSSGTFG